MRVARADDTKSWVDIRVSRGGFGSREEAETVGGGLAQSSVIEEESRVPRCFEAGSDRWIKEEAWISL